MARPRVLHICNWYPNPLGPGETPFIQRHVRSIEPHCENTVWHIEVRRNDQGWKRFVGRSRFADRTLLFLVPIRWMLPIEWASFLLVVWAWLTRDRRRRFDLVNIHIAYPLAVHYRMLRRMFRLPVVFTEQWSAYHYSFNSSSTGLDRARSVFGHHVPLIAVSQALVRDIERFSGHEQHRVLVVDNVAETAVFHPEPGILPMEGRFLAVAGWRFPKRPDVLIDLVARAKSRGRRIDLRLVGGGPMMPDMRLRIKELGIEDQVVLLGPLPPERVAMEMRHAHALLHASDYETYCAVCAEALCVGTPVIASQVGGIPEYMTPANGALVERNEAEEWEHVLEAHWNGTLHADRAAIARGMFTRAGTEAVGKRYAAFLEQVLNDRGAS